jgi:hypothetical protein
MDDIMNVSAENIFNHDNDPDGFDIICEASELGLSPGTPPDEITLKLPSAEVIKFELCARVVDNVDRLLHWSYWNEGMGFPAINLQILND